VLRRAILVCVPLGACNEFALHEGTADADTHNTSPGTTPTDEPTVDTHLGNPTSTTGTTGATETATTPAPGLCSPSGWCWEYPLPQGNPIQSIYAADASHVYATEQHGIVLLHDGANGSEAIRSQGDHRYNAYVHGSGADDVWVTGHDAFQHFDGAGWASYPVIEGEYRGIWVASPTDAYAIGYDGLALHWDGTDWTFLPTGTTASLSDVWVSPTGEAWIVGSEGTILRGDANGLAPAAYDPSAGDPYWWWHVWGTSDSDVWVSAPQHLAHYDGTDFTTESPGSPALDDLWGPAPDDLYLCSVDLLRLAGGTWSTVTDPGLPSTQPFVVHGSAADNVWVGGDSGLLARFDGAAWEGHSSTVLHSFSGYGALWGFSSDDLWAVGGGGVVVHRESGAWTATLSPVTGDLRGVWGAAPDDVWAVGDGLVHYDGTGWRDRSHLVYPYGLNDIWGVSGELWIVGDGGAIYHRDATGWRAEETEDVALHAVWAAAPDDVWAVGSGNAIVHYDGSAWQRVDHPRDGEPYGWLRAIRGAAADDIWAVGDTALPDAPPTLVHFDGTAWTDRSAELPAELGRKLHALWVDGAEIWIGSGIDGDHIGHFDGTTWSVQDTDGAGGPLGLWGDAASIWAAGSEYHVGIFRWDRR
jgi:hypothetical protein